MDPQRHRWVYHRPKSGVNWPLWLILGAFVVGVIGFLAVGGRKTSRPRRPAPPTVPRAPEDCEKLPVGGCYCLTRTTPLCAKCGREPAEDADGHQMLPAGAQIGIIEACWVNKVRWYQVQAVAPDGKTELGTGWISSTSLKGQRLKLLR